jgi:hypothetical protein
MPELSEEQKQLIENQFNNWAKNNEGLVTENKKILADLTLYKWIFRGILAFLLGGSIAGGWQIGRQRVVSGLNSPNYSR